MVPAFFSRLTELLGGIGADVEDHLLVAHFIDRPHVRVRRGRELARHDHIGRQRDLAHRALCALSSSLRATSSISASCSDLPTLTPVAARNVLAIPPPTIS